MKEQRWSVRCPQRTKSVADSSNSPLRTADATTMANVLAHLFQITRCSVRCPQRTKRISPESNSRLRTAHATTLHSIDCYDLSGVGPIVSIEHQTGTKRIVPNVTPFFAIRFIVSHHVIVKSGLPKRPQSLATDPRILETRRDQRGIQSALQSFDPFTHGQLSADAETDKQMNVVRHNDVPTNADPMMRSACTKGRKTPVDTFRCKNRAAQMRVERHEIKRRIVFLEDALQPRRFALALGEHDQRCSLGDPQRTRTIPRGSNSPLRTADATTTANVLARQFQITRCSVRCPQRIFPVRTP
jgi:hypothetical protein